MSCSALVAGVKPIVKIDQMPQASDFDCRPIASPEMARESRAGRAPSPTNPPTTRFSLESAHPLSPYRRRMAGPSSRSKAAAPSSSQPPVRPQQGGVATGPIEPSRRCELAHLAAPRYRIGRALEFLGMVAFCADQRGQRTADVAGLAQALEDRGEIPLRPPAELPPRAARCRRRGRSREHAPAAPRIFGFPARRAQAYDRGRVDPQTRASPRAGTASWH